MAYRNGTYVAFHANNTSDPTASDMKYYTLLKGWDAQERSGFELVDSHEKGRQVRDGSSRATLERELKARLAYSKNMVLIIGDTTKNDLDWVPMEIAYAVDVCKIPIIAAYPRYETLINPAHADVRAMWPEALRQRIDNGTARVIHVAFKQQPLIAALKQFDFNTPPDGSLVYYLPETYRKWGLGTN